MADVIPDPLIIVDTREQRPFVFEKCPTEVRKLDTGDYSIDGLVHRVCVERKATSDFINSVTNARERFMREVKRMAAIKRANEDDGTLVCVIVEGSMIDVKNMCEFDRGGNFNSIIATSAMLHSSWGIPVLFAGERWMAARYTEELLKKFNRTAIKRGLSRE